MPIGPNYCGSAANVSGGFGNAWLNPSNIIGAPDGSNTIVSSSGTNSDFLDLTNWGFNAHPLANINKIILDLYGSSSNNASIRGSLIINGTPINPGYFGPILGNWSSSVSGIWHNSVFGDPLNFEPPLWDSAAKFYSASIINNSNFGCRLYSSGSGSGFIISLDSARMTIYWSDGTFQTMYSKNTRKFKMTRNHRTKVVSQGKFKGEAA